MNNIILKFRFTIMGVFFCFLLAGCNNAPSDEAMINHFQENKSDFELLVHMLNEDKSLKRLAIEDLNLIQKNMDTERLQKYRQLFEKLRIKQALRINQNEISFTASYTTEAGPGKGWVYTKEPKNFENQIPAKLIENLDAHIYSKTDLDYRFIRKIEPTWYLEKSL